MSLTFWNPNSVFSGYDDIFTDPIVRTAIFGQPALTRFKTDTTRQSSPRYEVTENNKQFRLAIDVPGFKPDSMKIELENDGRILHVTGGRKATSKNSYKEYKFDKRFNLGKDLDTAKITAHLADGVLVLTAPKKEKKPPATREIAITQGEAPALMDMDEKEAQPQ